MTGRKIGLAERSLREYITDKYIMLMLTLFPLFTGFKGYANITLSKYLFFTVATGVWLALLLILSLIERKKPKMPSRPQIAAMALMLVGCLSAVMSEFPASEVFLGLSSRFDGLLTLLMYALVFICISAFGSPRRSYVNALAFSLTICCAAAVFQLFGVNILGLFPNNYNYYDANILYTGQFLGTMGNVDVLNGLLCIAIPAFFTVPVLSGRRKDMLLAIPLLLSAFVLFEANVSGGVLALAVCALVGAPLIITSCDRLRRALFMGSAVLLALACALCFCGGYDGSGALRVELLATSSMFACLIAADLMLLGYFAMGLRSFSVDGRVIRYAIIGIEAAAVIAGAIYVYAIGPDSGPLNELHELLHGNLDDSFGSSRILIWRRTLGLVPEHLFIGGGSGTLPLRLDVVFSRLVEQTSKTMTTSVDNAHNVYLGYLVNTGLAGLAAYLGIVVPAIRSLFANGGSAVLKAFELSVLCFAVHGLFSIGLCFSTPIFWILLGLVLACGGKAAEVEQ